MNGLYDIQPGKQHFLGSREYKKCPGIRRLKDTDPWTWKDTIEH